MSHDTVALTTQARWRTGRQVGRTIYAIAGTGDHTDDHLIGLMDTRELAARAVTDHNRALDEEGDDTVALDDVGLVSAPRSLVARVRSVRPAVPSVEAPEDDDTRPKEG